MFRSEDIHHLIDKSSRSSRHFWVEMFYGEDSKIFAAVVMHSVTSVCNCMSVLFVL